eukprot:7019966-Pyramimonas_sp.AAC.1
MRAGRTEEWERFFGGPKTKHLLANFPGPSWGRLGALSESPGPVLGLSRDLSGPLRASFGQPWEVFLGSPLKKHLLDIIPGPSWGRLGALLGLSWAVLGLSWAVSGPSCA